MGLMWFRQSYLIAGLAAATVVWGIGWIIVISQSKPWCKHTFWHLANEMEAEQFALDYLSSYENKLIKKNFRVADVESFFHMKLASTSNDINIYKLPFQPQPVVHTKFFGVVSKAGLKSYNVKIVRDTRSEILACSGRSRLNQVVTECSTAETLSWHSSLKNCPLEVIPEN